MFLNNSLFRNVFFQPYNVQDSARIRNSAKNSKHLVQRLSIENVSENHNGCVNSVHWNDTGSLLLTAGDDTHIVITNPFLHEVIVDYETKHETQIFCAKFLPTTDNRIISCSEDGCILNLDLHRLKETERNFFICHSQMCFDLETIPDEPSTFLSGSEDGTVRQFDLRSSTKCFKEQCNEHVLVDCGKSVSTIAINPLRPHQLAIATIDSIVRIVDRRKIITQNPACKIVPECTFTVPHLSHDSYFITSLSYSPDGRDLLVNYAQEDLYLFSLDSDPKMTAVANDFLDDASKPPSYRRMTLRDNLADTGLSSRPSADTEIRTQSEVVAQIVEMNNVPMAVSVTECVTNSEVSDHAVNTADESLDSNGNNERVDKKVKFKTINRPPGFDDIVPFQPIKAQYKGHLYGCSLIKEATFWGNNFIMSGSDCGHVFVWDRYTCEIVMLLLANCGAVNCIQPHPSRPILATSGVGTNTPNVKLWSPKNVDNVFSQSFAELLVERNILKNEEMMVLRRFSARFSPSISFNISSSRYSGSLMADTLMTYYKHVMKERKELDLKVSHQTESNKNGAISEQPTQS